MKVLVGLGNPGSKYESSRHNAGFLLLDKLAERYEIAVTTKKFDGVMGRGEIMGQDCVLLKPMTFMNLSGRSVAQLIRFFKVLEKDIVVIHDDIDVPFGKVKSRVGGGHGGHNGIKSIIEETGISNFHRIKLGVGRPVSDNENAVVNWVLAEFGESELNTLNAVMFDEVLLRLKNVFIN